MNGELQKNIRVLVVDDSPVMRNILIQELMTHPRIQSVDYAISGMDALNKVEMLQPDVLTLDMEMPGMSGIHFLKQLMPERPLPVIVVSSLPIHAVDSLAAGAADFIQKPGKGQSRDSFIAALTAKIIAEADASAAPLPHALPSGVTGGRPSGRFFPKAETIIGLGASTGGTEAILQILQKLPADIPGMVVVQHLPAGFTKSYSERLQRLCPMEVREAVHGDQICRGQVLIAPANRQTRILRSGTRYLVSCKPGEKISGHCPSVDALFFSMANSVTCNIIGIILTGMGQDGANGLLAMRKAGAFTIGQDEASSTVYGMPMVAHQIGAVQVQASCEAIPGLLQRYLRNETGEKISKP